MENQEKIAEATNSHSDSLRSKSGLWLWVILGLALLVIFAAGFWGYKVFIANDVSNYKTCVAKYKVVMKSEPPQCQTPDGRRFIEGVDGQISFSAPDGMIEKDVDGFITGASSDLGTPDIISVTIKDKLYYTDNSGTIWLKYVVEPIPADATDPGTGIAKKLPGGEWQMVNFGTAGLDYGLSADVVSALGLASVARDN